MRILPRSIPLLFALIHGINSQFSTDFKGTSLAGGTITTVTDVSERADIALDLRDMAEAIEKHDDYVVARNIYIAGSNSAVYDANKDPLPYKRSLRSLSRDEELMKDLTFNFQLYGLNGMKENGRADRSDYADSFVIKALDDKESGTLGVEAAVALNLWMYVTHELWDSMRDCTLAVNTDEKAADVLTNNDNGARSFDSAMAFYVGTGQVPGSDNGYGLYALAQRMGARFGTLTGGIAEANRKVALYFEIGKTLLAQNGYCESNLSLQQLWTMTNLMISAMTIPLVQGLIAAMVENDQGRVQIYALAIVPQMSACRASTYRSLKEKLLDRQFNQAMLPEILTDLQSMYDCLGIICDDIGAYQDDSGTTQVAKCADRPEEFPMAGYTPTTNVHQNSKIDLDILQISLLTLMEEYDDALYIYKFGKNSHLVDPEDQSFRTLQSLAIDPNREEVRLFEMYENYFNNKRYADLMVLNILDESSWNTPQQRSKAISIVLSYQVMYMAILMELQDVVHDCEILNSNDNAGGRNAWDEVAAFIIGSLEGPKVGGSDYFDDGQLFWHLANIRCMQFNSCNDEEYATVNNEVENLLFAGQAQLNTYDCENLVKTTRNLEHILLVPLVQSVISYAITIQPMFLDTKTNNVDLAAGQEYAQTILPILQNLDPEQAGVVKRNMFANENEFQAVGNEGGAIAVGDACYHLLNEFGVKCHFAGMTSNGVDACTAYAAALQSASDATSLNSRTCLLALGSIMAALGLF